MSSDTDRIRMLNDQLRQRLTGGNVFLSSGIAALGAELVSRLVLALTTFSDFSLENDPYGEHDFGMFDFEGKSVLFKIDYYDSDRQYHSTNPADPAVTERVITLMLAEEY